MEVIYMDYNKIKDYKEPLIIAYEREGKAATKYYSSGAEYFQEADELFRGQNIGTKVKYLFKPDKKEPKEESKDKEILKPYKDYYISNKGRVFSIRNNGSLMELSIQTNANGKHYVAVFNTTMCVDRLVFLAFKGLTESEMNLYIDHIDGDITNDSPDNLRLKREANKIDEKAKKIAKLEAELKKLKGE